MTMASMSFFLVMVVRLMMMLVFFSVNWFVVDWNSHNMRLDDNWVWHFD
jgi:hypothetical protein